MTDQPMPADWAIRRAKEETGEQYLLDAFARYIEKHEQPPVDPDVLDVRRILAANSVFGSLLREMFLNGSRDNLPEFLNVLAEYKKIKGERR